MLYGTRFQPAEMPGLERKQRGSVVFMPISKEEGQQHKLLDKDLYQKAVILSFIINRSWE